MSRDFILLISLCGFVSAIFICSFIKLGFSFFLFLVLLSIIIFIFQKFFVTDLKEKRVIFLISIFVFSFAVGVLRYEIKDIKNNDIYLSENLGKKVVIEGIISDEPNRKDKTVMLTVDFKQIIFASSSVSVSGKGIISTDLYPEFKYGDMIKISGKLEKPENFPSTSLGTSSLSSTNSFDYVSYLEKDDIEYKIDFAKTEFVSSGYGNLVKISLFWFKNKFIDNLNKVIGEPQSSLMSGIILGAKNSMDEDTKNNFRIAGLSHIVALSGYNITIVAESIIKFFSFLPRNFALSGGVVGIILFVIMTGSSSTAIRAGIMSLIVVLAGITRRKYKIGRALLIAGVIMLLFNPKILVFDTSFQLSFLATIAIIYVAPILKEKIKFITDKFGLRDIISSTISAQILVLPLLLYKMGIFSFVALPANILILAFISTVMLFGFLTGIIGFVSLIVSLPFAWVSWFLLSYMIKVSEFFASLPFAYVNVSWFSEVFLLLSYIIIVIWFLRERKVRE
ncbi:MAG: ComEC/Rec2 family competence protein [bacterium]